MMPKCPSALAWSVVIALAATPPSVRAQDAVRKPVSLKQMTVERMSAGTVKAGDLSPRLRAEGE
jgi:hypothetical protein